MSDGIDLVVVHCKQLVTCKNPENVPKKGQELESLDVIPDGAIAVSDGRIVFVGKTADLESQMQWRESARVMNGSDYVVMPGWVDCHTHAVFGGTRAEEFVMRLKGATYLEIQEKGGGISGTVRETEKLSEEDLASISRTYLDNMLVCGTTTVEIKTGYGFEWKNEEKMLRTIEILKSQHPLDIVATFLGAHAVPPRFRENSDAYTDEVIEMLPRARKYAEFCDVFCEGGFSAIQTRRILNEAKRLGYKTKIHIEQFSDIGGAEIAADLEAVSADHLDHVTDRGIEKMASKGVIGVLLPGVTFFLGGDQYAPAKKMMQKGLPIAVATDFNPGSCPSENMQLMISLACIKMGMTPEAVIQSATINGAHAICLAHEVGSLEVGKKADFILLKVPDYRHIPYRFGINHVDTVVKEGRVVVENGRLRNRLPLPRNQRSVKEM